jgi:uncharacterized protein YjbJ (UPF0337 family)
MDNDRIAGADMERAYRKAEGAVGEMAGESKTEASGRPHEAAGTVQNLYGQAKDAAREAADTAVNYAKDTLGNSDTLRSGQQALSKTVHDNPIGALLVAGSIGFALALMLTRPPRRPPPSRWRHYG